MAEDMARHSNRLPTPCPLLPCPADPVPQPGSGACCAGECVASTLLYFGASALGLCCIVHSPTRQAMKRKYNINKDEPDCLMWVGACALCVSWGGAGYARIWTFSVCVCVCVCV